MNLSISSYCLAVIVVVVVIVVPGYINAQSCFTDKSGASAIPTPTIHPDLYRGQQQFTVTMLEAIRQATPNENVFFSPYSTYHALLLAYFGAGGETEKELSEALHLGWAKSKADVRSGYRIEKQRRANRASSMPLEFSSADKIYFDRSVKLDSCMKTVLHDELEEVDFHTQSEQCRQQINGWIANLTKNEIPEMLAAGDVTGETQLVLANAAYFKGQWTNQFNAADTKQEIFYTSSTEQLFVDMMHKTGTYYLTTDERLGAHVLQLPFRTSNDDDQESDIWMVVVLPPFTPDSLENVLSKLKPDSLDLALKEAMPREIDISIPKFEYEQKLELVPILREMNIKSIFEPSANLTGFSALSNLMFGDAKHFAKIKVDEEGSTAAAATVFVSFRSARPVEPTKFECNHPFLFLIYDNKSKAILFTGIYRNPKSNLKSN